MSYFLKSKTNDVTEKKLSSEEEQDKINEVRNIVEPLSTPVADLLSDASISRFLGARNWNAEKACKMLKEAIKWRLEYKPETTCWEDIAQEAQTGKIYKTDYLDNHGRTVLVLRPGLENTSCTEGQIKYLIYCLENAILTAEKEQMVFIVDFQNWTMASVSIKMARETMRVLQDYYPERLELAIVYNPPRIFEAFWKIVKPFIDHKTQKKVRFVYSKNLESKKIMANVFDMDKLGTAFGGMNPVGFDFSTYAARMKEDDKKMDAFLRSRGGLLSHQQSSSIYEAASDTSSEASYYSGDEAPEPEGDKANQTMS